MRLLERLIDRQFQTDHPHHIFVDELVVKIERLREYFLGNTLPLPTAKVIAAWNDLPNVTTNDLLVSMKTELVFLRAPPPTPTGLAFDTDAPTSSDLNSLSSDQESLSSSGGASPTPVGFHNMVNQWLLDYRARGMDAFIESWIAFGVVSVGTALLASRIARALVRKVAKVSDTEAKNLENTVRFSTLAAFKRCWELSEDSTEVSATQANTAPPTPYGVNIASLMGSLLGEKISTAKDIHLCLSLLSNGEKRFDRLCAMHALLVQANDKLCKNRNLPALMEFRDGITTISGESGEYLWATTPRSKMILDDILATIERWMVSQALRREQSEMSSWTGNRAIRNRAVGPRLRHGPVTAVFEVGL
ncbi:hypothetical protein OG21DRAFT_1455303 [Imleria badia]|nr:hypothetical protein OG21DRAFT_1455303 [Imleria badia]